MLLRTKLEHWEKQTTFLPEVTVTLVLLSVLCMWECPWKVVHVDLVTVTGSTNLVNMAGDYFEAGPAQMFTHHTQCYWPQSPRIGHSYFQLTESVPVLFTDILPCLWEFFLVDSFVSLLFPTLGNALLPSVYNYMLC